MPGIAAVGMNTAARISAMATTGPPTCFHGVMVRVARSHAFVDMVLNGFDHDDGVVDHQADREHETEERERVDGEAERGER